MFRLHGEAGVETRQEVLQHRRGLVDGPGVSQAQFADQPVSRVNYICRLVSISCAGSPPRPGRVAGLRWCGSWGRQTPG